MLKFSWIILSFLCAFAFSCPNVKAQPQIASYSVSFSMPCLFDQKSPYPGNDFSFFKIKQYSDSCNIPISNFDYFGKPVTIQDNNKSLRFSIDTAKRVFTEIGILYSFDSTYSRDYIYYGMIYKFAFTISNVSYVTDSLGNYIVNLSVADSLIFRNNSTQLIFIDSSGFNDTHHGTGYAKTVLNSAPFSQDWDWQPSLSIIIPANKYANSILGGQQPSDAFEVFPNPTNGSFNISYTVSNPSAVYATIYDAKGSVVDRITISEVQSPGSYSYNYNADKLSAGVYNIIVQCNNQYVSKLVVKSAN